MIYGTYCTPDFHENKCNFQQKGLVHFAAEKI